LQKGIQEEKEEQKFFFSFSGLFSDIKLLDYHHHYGEIALLSFVIDMNGEERDVLLSTKYIT